MAGPEKHLSEDEVQIVQDYLEKGGDALFMIEHTVITTVDKPLTEQQEGLNPSLNEILSQWGLGIENDIVVDLASHASGDVGSPATKNYMAHKAIVGGLDYTFFVRPRSIRMLRDKPKDVKLAPLILTSSKETSWGESNRYLDVKFDPNEDRAGPVPIAFVGWQPQMGVSGKASDTRFIVVTDVDFISNALIDAYSNAQLGVNMLNWLTEKDYQTFLSKEGVDVIRLDLTSQQKRMIVAILMFTLLATASVGIWVWLGQLER